MTLRRRSPGILGEVTAAYETGFDYYPSEGFVVPGSDIEDRDGMGFHVVCGVMYNTTISWVPNASVGIKLR